MKTLTTFFTFVLTIFFACTSQADNWTRSVRGNGNVTKVVREVQDFQAIKASSGINVYLFQGTEEKVVVEADENLQDCIITKVEGNTLKCYIDCNVRNSTKLNVYVNFISLEKIKASSGSDVYGETLIKTNSMEIDASSAADVKLELEAEWVRCQASSGADIVVKGKTASFKGDASSGGDVKARDLIAKEATASASSGGDVQITATDKIKANASSGGDVTYWGKPDAVHESESSGGDVRGR